MTNTCSLQTCIVIAFYSLFIISCNDTNKNSSEKIHQSENPTVTIESQTWASRNLDITTFRNGDHVAEAKTDEEWRQAEKERKPAWCYYYYDSENGDKYGKLYNWSAVSDLRCLAPAGYHIPSSLEWETLVSNLGGRTMAGNKLKSKSGWREEGNGTNESAFSAVPGGYQFDFGDFENLGYSGVWWTSNQQEVTIGLNGLVWYGDNYTSSDNTNGPGAGLSVRCIKD